MGHEGRARGGIRYPVSRCSFVYGATRLLLGGQPVLEVEVHARANSHAVRSGCGRPGPGYHVLPVRRFELVPRWGIQVFLLYAMRRVTCGQCGVRVGQVPWAQRKHQVTTPYAWFLADWAERLSWRELPELGHQAEAWGRRAAPPPRSPEGNGAAAPR